MKRKGWSKWLPLLEEFSEGCHDMMEVKPRGLEPVVAYRSCRDVILRHRMKIIPTMYKGRFYLMKPGAEPITPHGSGGMLAPVGPSDLRIGA